MTDRRNRQFDRAVREYQRAHPGTTLPQAREIVAARASRQDLSARIPAAPLPEPGETLAGYVKRVATAAGIHRHRAMELLGLEPGTSAAARLDELAAGLPEAAVRALCAATGMTPDQAHALTTPAPAKDATDTLPERARQVLDGKTFQRGGEGKTRLNGAALARLFAQTAQRPLLIDKDWPRDLGWADTGYSPVVIDLPWPSDGQQLPTDPDFFDEIAQELGLNTGSRPSKKPGTHPRNDRT